MRNAQLILAWSSQARESLAPSRCLLTKASKSAGAIRMALRTRKCGRSPLSLLRRTPARRTRSRYVTPKLRGQRAAATKDVDRIVSYYADDASVFPANAPIAKSKDEIKKLWSGLVGAAGPRSLGKPPLRSRRRARGASRSLACRCTPACKEKPSRKGVFEGLLR